MDGWINSGRGLPHSRTQAKAKAKPGFAPAYGVRQSSGAVSVTNFQFLK
jgi:hypothetical protein